jgi:hypothetical protein
MSYDEYRDMPCFAHRDASGKCNHTNQNYKFVNDLKADQKAGYKRTRRLSWEFRDSSHGEAYRRGSTMVTMGPARDRANRDTSVYPGSGPSRLEVNPYFLPASY